MAPLYRSFTLKIATPGLLSQVATDKTVPLKMISYLLHSALLRVVRGHWQAEELKEIRIKNPTIHFSIQKNEKRRIFSLEMTTFCISMSVRVIFACLLQKLYRELTNGIFMRTVKIGFFSDTLRLAQYKFNHEGHESFSRRTRKGLRVFRVCSIFRALRG